MSSNDTQPLIPEQLTPARMFSKERWEQEQAGDRWAVPNAQEKAWQEGMEQYQAWLKEPVPIHVHGPFAFLLNQNHNALRGCTTCGQAWVGLMAGNEHNLVWHPIGEIEEEE